MPTAAVHLYGMKHTPFLFYVPFLAVAKNKVVQLSVVRCQISQETIKSGSKSLHTKRSSIQESYRRMEVWSLQDLTLVDGRDPDVVISQTEFLFLIISLFTVFYKKDDWLRI